MLATSSPDEKYYRADISAIHTQFMVSVEWIEDAYKPASAEVPKVWAAPA
jgi:hypothetical protein